MCKGIPAVIGALLLCALPASAQDLVQTAHGMARVVLENDKVRVIELTVPPNGRTGMHSHGDSLVYFLTPNTSQAIDAQGAHASVTQPAGEAKWIGPVRHDTVNTGTNTTRTLIVELKSPAR